MSRNALTYYLFDIQEKIIKIRLSRFNNYKIVAHKMIDWLLQSGFYKLCSIQYSDTSNYLKITYELTSMGILAYRIDHVISIMLDIIDINTQ
jgi:hypothetical protein